MFCASCATTQLSKERSNAGNSKPAKPERILCYDFASNSADRPAENQAEVGIPATPPSADELAAGRALGAEVANQLVTKIREMGLNAVRADRAAVARPND